MNEQRYFGQFSGLGYMPWLFEIVQHAHPKGTLYLLVDDQKMVYIKGQPFGTIDNAMFEHWYLMPRSEAEAWQQLPT